MIGLFQRYVFHNFGLKVLSLLLAAGLWFLISPDEQPAEVAVRAPIVFQHVPAQLEISSELIPEAQIRVRGPERVIRQLQANEVHAEIELADAKPGERTFDLTSLQVRHPHGVTIVQVVPSQLHLAFDTRLTRDVEIHPRVTGNFADGDQIVKVDADPAPGTTSRKSMRRRPIPSMRRARAAAPSSTRMCMFQTRWCKSCRQPQFV
jgi:hypothetical protein